MSVKSRKKEETRISSARDLEYVCLKYSVSVGCMDIYEPISRLSKLNITSHKH